jgi:hypothetical protein
VFSSSSEDQLYARLACPSAYFPAQRNERIVTVVEIKVIEGEAIVDSVFDLSEHISFVAIKGVSNQGQEVFYKTIEVATFWGQLSRTSQTHKLTVALFLIVSVCALLWFVRYNARRGYVQVLSEPQ